MYSLRFIAISALIALPFFAFAQTATSAATTTAEQPPSAMEARAAAQVKIDAMAQDYLNSFPTSNEINLKAIVDDINIKTDPQDPGPGETITATLVGYITDLTRATISWSVNGKVISSGVGQKIFTFQNGQSGETTAVRVTIITANGKQVQKVFSFTPIGVTVLWEADTYAPPFYKGKPLLPPEARVRVTAIPDIGSANNSLAAGNLVYTWEKNGMAQVNASGYQKNSFSFTAPLPYGKTGASVSVSSLTGSMQSKRKIDVPLSNPFILFYDNNPLLGVLYNHSFGTTLSLAKREFSVSAEPYFFSNERSDTPSLKYNWSVNGKEVQNNGRNITLRNDTGAEGESLVSLAMHGLKQTFQLASQDLRVHFGASESTSRPTF